jgi:hypothetical protein
MEFLAALIMIILAVLAAVVLVVIVIYILTAIAVYKIAKRKGIDHAFLAWIPIAQTYQYAELIGTNVKIGSVTIPQYPWIYAGIVVLGSAITNSVQYVSNYTTYYSSPEQLADSIMETGANFASSMGSLAATIIVGIISLIILVVRAYTMYRVFKLFQCITTLHAVLFTVLSVIFPIAQPIILLVLSGKPFAEETEPAPAA